MVKSIVFSLLLWMPAIANAAEAIEWQLNPEKSTIEWVATQNGAPVEGAFKSFTADITFHPEDLANSTTTVTVDMASIATDYVDVEQTLKEDEWFFVADFPSAVFKTNRFEQIDAQNFVADATLTIKSYTVPVKLNFLLHHMHDNEIHIIGETTIRRNDFHIGWPDTDQIADKVTVKVEVKANR